MKNLLFTSLFAFLLAASSALTAQNYPDEYLGLPGDNLNLFAVMNLFQDSETLEAFERSLNDPEIMINNLDLNGDNYVDYIMVYDYVEGSVHNIVLRVALSQNEFQDVAVFTVEKFRNGSVLVQLIGDEALYGPNYIVEPNYAERPNPGYRGNVQQQATATSNVKVVHTTYYEVASWPVIVYLSRPSYRPWRSAWYWGYTPTYWQPWTPFYYHYYYGYHFNSYTHYYTYYRPWHRPRSVRYKTVYYTKIRNYSPTVVVNVNKGVYKNTYSRPESRREGEVLYSQRKAVGGTVTTRRSAVNQGEAVSRSRTANDDNARVARPDNAGNAASVSGPRNASSSGRTETSRGQGSTVNSSREQRNTDTNKSVQGRPERSAGNTNQAARPASRERVLNTPERSSASTAPRPANQSSRSGTAAPDTRERPTAPAQKVEQPSTRTNRAATRNAPANTNRSTTRTAPAKSNRTETRTTPARSNRTETRTAPASSSRSESKSSRVSKPQTSRSSQPAKNVKSAETKRPSRSSASSVQQDKSKTQRSSTPAKSGRTPSRSGSSRSPNK